MSRDNFIPRDPVRTIRHFENRRGEGPGDEVAQKVLLVKLIYKQQSRMYVKLRAKLTAKES